MMTRFQHFPIRATPCVSSLALCGILLHILASSVTQAQVTTAITPDGTLGTQVTQNGDSHDITGGTRPGEGSNLFHSFGQFSVGASDTANFLNNTGAPTTNILGRVTGGQVSNIFGTVQTTGFPGANLFLMNPAGMVFGPNASLNVSGAVHFTTADFLRLADGVQFNAMPGSSDALLTSAPVESFGFLSDNPAGITVGGSSLRVPEGETLSLVGGDLTIAGNPDQPPDETIPSLAAERGRVNLVSVGAAGEVEPITPDVSVDSFENLGEITFSKAASVDTSGDGGGTVVIRGGRLTVDESRISANTTGPTEGPLEGQSGMGIDIQVAEDLLLDNGSFMETNVSENVAGGTGSGGIRVRANQVEFRNKSNFRSNTSGLEASSGNIKVKVENDLVMRNGSFINTVAINGQSIAGDIEVLADRVLLSGTPESPSAIRSQIAPSTSKGGATGEIRVTANRLEMFDSIIDTATFGAGNAGNLDVNISGGNVFISGSGDFNATTPFGIFANTVTLPNSPVSTGAGGHLQLTAHNLTITNLASVQAITEGTGPSGGVTVNLTGKLDVRNGAFIQTRALPGFTGDAGDLSITAQDIVVTGISDATNFEASPGFTGISAAAADGPGGNLNIEANNLTVRDKAFVNTATRGSGNSGNLSINLSGNLLIENGGLIFADAQIGAFGNAGAIDIQADSIVLSGANPTPSIRVDGSVLESTRSTITSQSRGEGGKGGDIQVTARHLSVLDSASITAESTSTGDAGSIEIRASDSILIENSAVTTEAEQADGGDITLMAPNIIRLIDSDLTTSVAGGPQTTGGNIDIDPQFVVLENSKIETTAIEGDGGNIKITAGAFLADPASVLDASSLTGRPGNVEINSPDTNIIAGTLELPESFLNVQSLLSTRCASRTTKPASSFFVTNGGLPLGPDTLLPAGVTGVGIKSGESDGPQSDYSDEIPELLVRTSAFGGCSDDMM